ncbi:ferredoxin-dependent glutamate [Plasmopara halstedii]|uniref:glutamate synthase (ferredoxin) n=1 Tax=Plasmopara halstedii TaxID=4781 RepID=A0A0P1B2S4_PLAHL|nr:ferredoxin-dependent glutamate [Plasmopara halstedii]CEG47654.1 ferredoxin-dependent glutamate [Plasmopara halstedii]|eukprot:XP_024584023.1 ferredoxin-dependent glutamate [Plasmopara halstedii]
MFRIHHRTAFLSSSSTLLNRLPALKTRRPHDVRGFRAIPGKGADKRAIFQQKGLYRKLEEKDSCGVGMIASLKKNSSRSTVVKANEMLVRMSHRGGCGCDPASGDGAGMLVALPHEFIQRVAKNGEFGPAAKLLNLEKEKYAVGNVFFNKSAPNDIPLAKKTFDDIAGAMGLKVVGWRVTPTTCDTLGATSLASEPHVEQVMVLHENPTLSGDDFEKELLRLRSVVTSINEKKYSDFYVNSLSNRTITYKGQLTPEQLFEYYDDLSANDFTSYVALVHSRFSTNTFPSWDRAQPNRIMCHNGEINTLRGNKNWMYARGGTLHSSYFGNRTSDLLPVCSDTKSDSGNFDAVLEILTKASSCNRSLPEGMMMMIPEAWQNDPLVAPHKKDMYKYQSLLMEPWDGPAMMAFTDGKYIGATLDRNGLRPSRYYVTKDDHVLLSSEIGVLENLPEKDIKYKRRLEPGKMFLVDFERGLIVSDDEVKRTVSESRPFKRWLDENLVSLSDLTAIKKENMPQQKRQRNYAELNRRLNMFGFTTETMDLLMMPMGITGKEALGSMGNDAPLAVLSEQPKLPFEYFKQLFAQVTNPPIDPIREELVMSLMCPVGPAANVLDATAEHAKRLMVEDPVMSNAEMNALKSTNNSDWTPKVLDATFAAGSGARGLVEALYRLCEQATDALVNEKAPIIVLSDKLAGVNRYPVPSLLAVGAVHQHLLRTQQRTSVALFTECGDAKEVHDICTLLGFGADAINPHMAEMALNKMNDEGLLYAHSKKTMSNAEVFDKYRAAVGKGILKVMSKMGISTLQSYKGAQVFEAVGLGDDIISMCFEGTNSRIQGTDFEALYTDISRFHEAGYPLHSDMLPLIRNPGSYHFRNDSEIHYNSPKNIVALQRAARENSREAYAQYVEETNALCKRVNLRGLLDFKFVEEDKMPKIDEMESVAEIVKRFNTGAMSLGSISQETHEALAIAMNSIGGRSNTGEGGEDVKRFSKPGEPPNPRRSAIKQVASGRFGVTMNYLTNADQLQIKMAQGAKPGEGGELPGHKVSDYIGSMRHTTPGVGLISPPPHHDIYSIEDLAQLIHDLKHSNPSAEVSVKLVSEVGVGVVAAGVAKAKSDHITVSGHDGGTGASSWTGVKNGGLPWELGLAETQQTLVLNNLRSRVKLQTDGQLKTGRDVMIAALLGAEEFGFATGPLIALGCIMMRKCHLNTCPVGIATQDPELRKKFQGQPEHVVNFMFMLAEEVRDYMRRLGFCKLDDLIGRADLLKVNQDALHYKSRKLDLSPLLINASSLNEGAGVKKEIEQDHVVEKCIDMRLIEKAKNALEDKTPVVIEDTVSNLDRTLGATLSHEICKRYGENGLPNGTIHLKLKGHGGQSLAFGLAKGIRLDLEGDSNDYVGKALSGGEVAVYPSSEFTERGNPENVIVGNAVLYGATSGEAFFSGKAGERFCVRNSGVKAVVEGVGDHGCEYMTGGRVVILGSTGRNFAAGMSGGIAYVFDEDKTFQKQCNMGMVGVAPLIETAGDAEIEEVKALIVKHFERTQSPKAQKVLENWNSSKYKFMRVMPSDYERVLLHGATVVKETEMLASASL